jgi:hypothetical protein
LNKKKLGYILFSLFLVAVTMMGTMAYYSQSFSSDNNIAKAAKFTVDAVDSSGKTIADAQFDLNDSLYPGMDPMEVYRFQIKKNDTEVPVAYSVRLNSSGGLFPANVNSPIVLAVQRQVDQNWVNFDSASQLTPANDIESFRIIASWPHGNNDIDFQGKNGTVKLEVVATQVDSSPNAVNGNLVKTTAGVAPVAAAKTIVSYKFDEGFAPKMNPFNFYIYDGDGFVNEWYGSSSQKVVNGVVSARTGAEVAEAIAFDINVKIKGSFTALTSKWDVTTVGSEVIFTSKADKAYDNFNIVIPAKDNRAEIKGEFLKKQAGTPGNAGVKQVNTLTVDGTINKAGKLTVAFEDGTENVTKSIAITKKETTATIAAKIVSELQGLNGWDVTYPAGTSSVIFTSKTAAADKNVNLTLTNN